MVIDLNVNPSALSGGSCSVSILRKLRPIDKLRAAPDGAPANMAGMVAQVFQSGRAKDCYGHSAHSLRKALTGSIEAARQAGMIPARAAASANTPMAIVITGKFTLVIS